MEILSARVVFLPFLLSFLFFFLLVPRELYGGGRRLRLVQKVLASKPFFLIYVCAPGDFFPAHEAVASFAKASPRLSLRESDSAHALANRHLLSHGIVFRPSYWEV